MYEIDYVVGLLNLSYFLSLISKNDTNELAPVLPEFPTKDEQLDHLSSLAAPERLQVTIPKLDRCRYQLDPMWKRL